VRLVRRHPQKTDHDDQELVVADLSIADDAERAVEGCDVAYLTAGLTYDHEVWEKTWPVIMENVIHACKINGTRLVFFDNNYMYDPAYISHMTEDTPIHPPGPKGKVRARIARRLMEVDEQGIISALIARSADFYGPGAGETALLNELVFKPLSRGKKASWMIADDKKHSFTFTPDAARATALLGNTPSAFGQIWHLPTASDPPTGREWIEKVARQLNQKPKYRVLAPWMLSVAGLFDKQIREFNEVRYQYERDYIFDSRKFEQHFDVTPTSYEEGIERVVAADLITQEKS
jgi:nucleoside-diphosphate-sugar epimerase